MILKNLFTFCLIIGYILSRYLKNATNNIPACFIELMLLFIVAKNVKTKV